MAAPVVKHQPKSSARSKYPRRELVERLPDYRAIGRVKLQTAEWELTKGHECYSDDKLKKLVEDAREYHRDGDSYFRLIRTALDNRLHKNGIQGLNQLPFQELKELQHQIDDYEVRLQVKEKMLLRVLDEKEELHECLERAIEENEELKLCLEKATREKGELQQYYEGFIEKNIAELNKRLNKVEEIAGRLEEQYNAGRTGNKDSMQPMQVHTVRKKEHEFPNTEPRSKFPETLHMKFRGSSHNPESSTRSFFEGGLYSQVLRDMDDWKESELGDLLVETTKHAFASVRDTLLWGVHCLLIELFEYRPIVLASPEEEARLLDISNAYGLLLCHFKDECWKQLPEIYKEKVKTDNRFHPLFKKAMGSKRHKELFKKFQENLTQQMRNMLSVSPPMVIHKPQTFEKDMIQRIPNTSQETPLVWLQYVIMHNYYGKVCIKGRAGNRKDLLKLEADDN